VTRVATVLADGRELLYFDDRPGAGPRPADTRDLPPREPLPEIRYDRVADEWVVIAAHRQGRTFLPPADDCPLDPSRPGRATEIPAPAYDVVVFENRFPSLAQGVPAPPGGLAGLGRCEVVCFTSDHDGTFSGLSAERLATVGRAWVDRTVEIGRMEAVEYVFVFENRGPEIGVTLQHPHGQIYGYPFLPPRVAQALRAAERHGGCLSCEVVADEIADGSRVIALTDDVVAFVPRAARWPYEVHVYPRRHVPDLPALAPAELAGLLAVYQEVLGRFDHLFSAPAPYVAGWTQAPVTRHRDRAHLHAEVFTIRRTEGKLKYLAGSESGAGTFINDVLPEFAAERLRAARP